MTDSIRLAERSRSCECAKTKLRILALPKHRPRYMKKQRRNWGLIFVVVAIQTAKKAGMQTMAVYDAASDSMQDALRTVADRYIMSFAEL